VGPLLGAMALVAWCRCWVRVPLLGAVAIAGDIAGCHVGLSFFSAEKLKTKQCAIMIYLGSIFVGVFFLERLLLHAGHSEVL